MFNKPNITYKWRPSNDLVMQFSCRSRSRAHHTGNLIPVPSGLHVLQEKRLCPSAVLTSWFRHSYEVKKSFKFFYNKTNQVHQLPKFTPAWNSTCFGQFLCPSSGVYSLYTWQWYMSYRFEDSFRVGPGWNCPKHVEFHAGVNLGNWCILLVLL